MRILSSRTGSRSCKTKESANVPSLRFVRVESKRSDPTVRNDPRREKEISPPFPLRRDLRRYASVSIERRRSFLLLPLRKPPSLPILYACDRARPRNAHRSDSIDREPRMVSFWKRVDIQNETVPYCPSPVTERSKLAPAKGARRRKRFSLGAMKKVEKDRRRR